MKHDFEHFGKHLIRTPAFELERVFIDNEIKDIDAILYDFLNDDSFLSSLYWASPDMYSIVKSKKYFGFSDKKYLLFSRAIFKYIIRSVSRCTPFGTFAGSSVKKINIENSTRAKKRTKKIQLDEWWINNLNNYFQEKYLEYLSFRINSTVYIQDNYYKFFSNDENDYQLYSIERNSFIDDFYRVFSGKVIRISEVLKKNSKYNIKITKSLINELIQIGFITNEIRIDQLYYSNNHENLRSNFPKIMLNELNYIFFLINKIKCKAETSEIDCIPDVEIELLCRKLESIGISKASFHADLYLEAKENQKVTPKLITEINESIRFIIKRSKCEEGISDALSEFKQEFLRRYELTTQNLTDVLDPEVGISFPIQKGIGTASLEGVKNNTRKSESVKAFKPWCQDWVRNIIESYPNNKSINLSEFDNAENIQNENKLPLTFNLIGSVLENNMFWLENISGPSAKSLTGRFSYIDESFSDLFNQIDQFEKDSNPNIIFADIIYLPLGRAANIAQAINYSDYEIIVTGKSNFSNHKIKLSEILISVINNEIILISKKLRRRIIPRLSNAHNFINSENIFYRFLASIQFQNYNSLKFEIDIEQSRKKYIPQLRYNNIVLHPATWVIRDHEILEIINSRNSIEKLKNHVKINNIPKYVNYLNYDQALLICTTNIFFLEILLDELKKRPKIAIFQEFFFEKSLNSINPNQVIIPYKNKNEILESNFSFNNEITVKRQFLPGSEWIYFKFYCSAYNSDFFLSECLSLIFNRLLTAKLIKKGFITRFCDPDYHIRFRVLVVNINDITTIIDEIHNEITALVDRKKIWKFQIDTYEREIERYESKYIENIESCFTADTNALFLFFQYKDFITNIKLRKLLAAISVDKWMDYFGLKLDDKISFCKKIINKLDDKPKIAIDREDFILLEQLFIEKKVHTIFKKREDFICNINLGKNNLKDIIHMNINRWFCSNQNQYEFQIYCLLLKYYLRISFK